MKKLIFVTLAVPGKSAQAVLMMARSIRDFAGNLAGSPIWILVPESRNTFSDREQAEFSKLDLLTHPYPLDPKIIQFPFAAKIVAAAVAESLAQGQSELLCYLDQDTLVLQEPGEFLLPAGKVLGYRPVHHKLIGPGWDEASSPFWELIYRTCEIPEDRLFQMTTHTGEKIKPYFNAGTFVIRPEKGLLTLWQETFLRTYRQPEFTAFYELNQLYAIFMHQAIWTGVLLHALSLGEMQLLSPKINYPFHLHNEVPEKLRPKAIHELTTLRYENIFDAPEWRENLPIADPLRSWLESRLQERESFKDAA
jgi:hypothetical protein